LNIGSSQHSENTTCLPLSGAELLAGAADVDDDAAALEAAAVLDDELLELLPQPAASAHTLAIIAKGAAALNAWRTLPTVLSPH
jgi:hypothetical protein